MYKVTSRIFTKELVGKAREELKGQDVEGI